MMVETNALTDGTLTNLLNSGRYGRKDWQQGKDYPIFGDDRHVVLI